MAEAHTSRTSTFMESSYEPALILKGDIHFLPLQEVGFVNRSCELLTSERGSIGSKDVLLHPWSVTTRGTSEQGAASRILLKQREAHGQLGTMLRLSKCIPPSACQMALQGHLAAYSRPLLRFTSPHFVFFVHVRRVPTRNNATIPAYQLVRCNKRLPVSCSPDQQVSSSHCAATSESDKSSYAIHCISSSSLHLSVNLIAQARSG
jgi:hypothetical protein